MPFIVDYTPLGALGSLAMTAGAAQGTTAGNRDFIARQSAVDAQTADINQRNRELDYAAGQRTKDFNREASFQRERDQMGFEKELALRDIANQGALDRAQLSAQAGYDRQQAAAEAALLRQREGIAQRGETREGYYDFRRSADEDALRNALLQQGATPEDAEQQVIEFRRQKILREGNFGPQSDAQTGFRTPTKAAMAQGFNAALTGQYAGSSPDDISYMAVMNKTSDEDQVNQMTAGALQYFMNPQVSLAEVNQVLSDPGAPPWLKAAAQRAIVRRPDVTYGQNIRPQNNQTPPSGVMGASDQDLLRAISGLR